MLADIGGGTSVFASEGETLQKPQDNERDRRDHAGGGVAWQHAHERGGETHDHDGDQERVLAADQIPQAAEYERAEWPYGKPGGKGQQREDEASGLVNAGEELLRDDRRQRAVQVEVVPLKDRTQA